MIWLVIWLIEASLAVLLAGVLALRLAEHRREQLPDPEVEEHIAWFQDIRNDPGPLDADRILVTQTQHVLELDSQIIQSGFIDERSPTMSTRGTFGFVIGEDKKLTYNHSDSYPAGLGRDLLTWLQRHLVEQAADTALDPAIVERVQRLTPVDELEDPSPQQVLALGKKYWREVSTGTDWYSYLRATQGDIDLILESGYLLDGGFEHGKYSLHCEWAYVINTNDNAFEVYSGGNKDQVPTAGLWAGVENPATEEITRADGSTYTHQNFQPVQLLWSIPFAKAARLDPADFVKQTDARYEIVSQARKTKDATTA